MAATVFRAAVMLNQFKHVPAAEQIRQTLFAPSGGPPASFVATSSSARPRSTSTQSNSSVTSISRSSRPSRSSTSMSSISTTTSSASSTTSAIPTPVPTVFPSYGHLTQEGWLAPVVNPNSFPHEGSMSPESEAFAIQLHSAWRDWVADGAKGTNGGCTSLGLQGAGATLVLSYILVVVIGWV